MSQHHSTAFEPTNQICYGHASAFTQRILSTAEIKSVIDAVDASRDSLWLAKWSWPGNRMFTIGEPFYQNRQRLRLYHDSARQLNHEIFRQFSFLYDRLAHFFKIRYGCPVLFASELAIPGFHIFEYDSPGEFGGGSWHFDRLHVTLPLIANSDIRVQASVNFTLPLEVPSGGTALESCDRQPGDDVNDQFAYTMLRYDPGEMVFSEKDYWHRMGSSTCLTQRERRITLQGHGVKLDDKWILFW